MHEDNKENDVVNDLGQLIHSQVAGGLFDPLEIPNGKPQPLYGRRGGQKHMRARAPLMHAALHSCSARCNAGSGQCNAGTAGSADGDAAEAAAAAAEAEAEAEAEATLDAKVPGLKPHQAAYMPDRAEVEARISAINGVALKEQVMANISPAVAAALAALQAHWRDVVHERAQEALHTCNQRNSQTVNTRYVQPVQKHGGKGAMLDLGTYPVTSAMPCEETLTAAANPTVGAVSYLEGSETPGVMPENMLANLMPTCLKKYTDVPTAADYKHFQPALRGLLGELYKAGLQVITAISERCRPDIEAVLHGDAAPLVEVLQLTLSRTRTRTLTKTLTLPSPSPSPSPEPLTLTLNLTLTPARTRTRNLTLTLTLTVLHHKNGSTLELHMPKDKPPVLVIFPAEHISHVAWQVCARPARF